VSGKSRFVHTFQDSDISMISPSNGSSFQTDEMLQQSFQPFKAWIKKLFGVSDTQSDTENWITFSRIMRNFPQPHPTHCFPPNSDAPLHAGGLININQPDTLYEILDAKGRYENTFIALSVLFAR
jgi:hypothetical protein